MSSRGWSRRSCPRSSGTRSTSRTCPAPAAILASERAARAPADGYTILMPSSSFIVNPSLYDKVPYDAEKDFIAVTMAGASPNGLFVNPNLPVKSVQELVALHAGQSRQIHVRVARHRHHAAPVERTVQADVSARFRRSCRSAAAAPCDPVGASAATRRSPSRRSPPATPLVKEGKLRGLAVTAKSLARAPGCSDLRGGRHQGSGSRDA